MIQRIAANVSLRRRDTEVPAFGYTPHHAAMSSLTADADSIQTTRRARRNVAVLVFAHAVLGSQLAVNIIVAGLAGALLAPDKSLATLPVSMVVLASMLAAPGASLLMGRFGRRAGFLLGALAGALGSAACAYALHAGSFAWLIAGTVALGVYQAFQSFFRFAAADTAPEAFKPKAISWVLAGGLLSALIGPEIVRLLADAPPAEAYRNAYLANIVLNVIGAAGLVFLDIPPPVQAASGNSGRPLGVIARQPAFIVAALCGMVGFSSMSLVMTSTPLAMLDHGFMTAHAADVVRWHIVAMFAPSFFTGAIIVRFGCLPVIGAGLALLAACGVIALAGVELHHFYAALVLLGVGWNFAFIGATALLGTTHTPAEQAKVQGLNDFLVLGFVAFGSFGSGALLNAFGWDAVQYAMLPALAVAAIGLLWLAAQRRRAAASLPAGSAAPR
jgi:MFS family permease